MTVLHDTNKKNVTNSPDLRLKNDVLGQTPFSLITND
jgi:hypothetical protein